MTPSPQTKASRVKTATASVKSLDVLIAKTEQRLAALKARKVSAVARRDWLALMPSDEPATVVEPVAAKDGAK